MSLLPGPLRWVARHPFATAAVVLAAAVGGGAVAGAFIGADLADRRARRWAT